MKLISEQRERLQKTLSLILKIVYISTVTLKSQFELFNGYSFEIIFAMVKNEITYGVLLHRLKHYH